MARTLKVFWTSLGFFELAIAAPSMKAAADAWGSDPDIFKRGFAKQTDDPKVVEAAIAKPGVVLRRPVGSQGEFSEHAALPKMPKGERKAPASREEPAKPEKKPGANIDHEARRAAAAVKEEEKRQALESKRREAERERARKQLEQLMAKANAAFEKARTRHDEAVASLTKRREELDEDEAEENERWEAEQRRHNEALKAIES